MAKTRRIIYETPDHASGETHAYILCVIPAGRMIDELDQALPIVDDSHHLAELLDRLNSNDEMLAASVGREPAGTWVSSSGDYPDRWPPA